MASFIPRKGPGGCRVYQAHIRRRGWPAQVRTFNSKAKARVWARQIEEEMDRGVFVSRVEAETTTLGEALERYSKEITSRKKGAVSELSRIRNLSSLPLAIKPLAAIRGKDSAGFVSTRESEGARPAHGPGIGGGPRHPGGPARKPAGSLSHR